MGRPLIYPPDEIRDGILWRRCSACNVLKPLTDFAPMKRLRNGRRHQCRDCLRERVNAYLAARPELRRNQHVRFQFGLNDQEYRALITAQQNRCAICGQPETRLSKNGQPQSLSVDHDHKQKKVRGLLCGDCNRGIGLFRDDPALLLAAAAYLERHQTALGSNPA